MQRSAAFISETKLHHFLSFLPRSNVPLRNCQPRNAYIYFQTNYNIPKQLMSILSQDLAATEPVHIVFSSNVLRLIVSFSKHQKTSRLGRGILFQSSVQRGSAKAEEYSAGSGGAALTLERESCNLLGIYHHAFLTLVKAPSPCARACSRQTAQKEKPYALYYFAGI